MTTHAQAVKPKGSGPRAKYRASVLQEAAFSLSMALFAFAAHFLRFGYRYGSSDQDETLPLVLRRLNERLFETDWFIAAEAGEIGVRWAFVSLLSAISAVVPVWAAFLLVHIASFFAVATAVFFLCKALSGSRLVAAVVLVISLVLTPQWTLGGNDLVHAILAPSTVAWAFALWALVLHLNGRSIWAGLLLGLATVFQALVGLQVAAVLFADLLLRTIDRRSGRAVVSAAASIGLFALVALPVLVPLAVPQLGQSPSEDAFPSLFFIMAEFRNPHHYLPLSFPLAAHVKFGLLLFLGSAGYLVLARRGAIRREDFLYRSLNVLALFFVVGFLFTEVVPLLSVAKLQLFKISVAAKPVLLTGIFAVLLTLFRAPRQLDDWVNAHRLRAARWVAPGGMVVLAVGLVLRFSLGAVVPLEHRHSDLGGVEAWARTNTPSEALFLIPPSVDTFRSGARRSVVVNFKTFPFEPTMVRLWFDRLLTVAPVELQRQEASRTLRRLDASYASQSADRLAALADAYEADYILLPRAIERPDVLREVYRSGDWRVYRPAPERGPHLTMANSVRR